MPRKIVLIVSLAAGLIAAVATRFYVASKEAEVADQKEQLRRRYGSITVLCFYRDLPAGTVLTREDFGERTVPALGMRGQAVEKKDANELVGRKTLLGHKYGDVVFWSDIEGGNSANRGLSADIKRQMRAMSVNCTGAAAVSGMVKPNDRVDVIATFSKPEKGGVSGARDIVTSTILQNVLVLATGRQTAKSQATDLGAAAFSTVTLEVTPREAEMLAFAEQAKGRLVLTLRNRNDTSYEKELPKVDLDKIQSEIEQLNLKRQNQRNNGL